MEYDIAQGKTRKLLVEQVNHATTDWGGHIHNRLSVLFCRNVHDAGVWRYCPGRPSNKNALYYRSTVWCFFDVITSGNSFQKSYHLAWRQGRDLNSRGIAPSGFRGHRNTGLCDPGYQ